MSNVEDGNKIFQFKSLSTNFMNCKVYWDRDNTVLNMKTNIIILNCYEC